MNRREFVGATAATSLVLSQGAQFLTGGETGSKLRVGIMGTGGRGTQLAGTFQREAGVEIAYTCDVDSARAERAAGVVAKIANNNRSPAAITDYRRILDDKTVDILVVATCNHWHAPATILGCAAGKHVYVEKPCSHNPREGELMVQAARKHKKQVQMGNQRRSWPKVIEAMDELRKGVIGRLYLAESWYQNNRPATGRGKEAPVPAGLNFDAWQGPAPRRPFRTNYLPYTWHWFWHWGNGELGNNGVHIIDLCRWALNVDYPIRAVSSGGRYRYDDDQETPDTHQVSFEFEGKKQIMWEGLSCSRQPGRPYHALFHGEEGTLALSDSSYTIYDPAGKQTRQEKVQAGDGIHIANFLNAVRGKVRLNSEIEEAYKSTLLCHLGNIAHRTGRALQCSSKDGHIQNDKAAMQLWTREYEKGYEPQV